MSDDVFGELYASVYDDLYGDLDYDVHTTEVARLLGWGTNSILDVGCGTGEFSKRFCERFGISVLGVDPSEHMLRVARKKRTSDKVAFVNDRAESFSVKPHDTGEDLFDGCIMMGGVLGYQQDLDGVIDVLRNIKNHVRGYGRIVFDVWNAPGVIAIGAGQRMKIVENESCRVMRAVSGELSYQKSLCTVDYNLWVERDGVLRYAKERHTVRYFTVSEIQLLLRAAGLSFVKAGRFPGSELPVGDDHWHMVVAAEVPT